MNSFKKLKITKNKLVWATVLSFLSSLSWADKLDELSEKVKILSDKNAAIEKQLEQMKKEKGGVTQGKGGITIATHGYIKADLLYDLDAKGGDRTNYGSIPIDGEQYSEGHVRLHARQTRFNVSAKKDTEYGPLKALIEVDFYGGGTNSPSGSEVISNSVNLRLRHAYVQFGKWSFGQMWSNYVDVKSFPENLDFSNDTGQAFLRQGQIRYTRPMGGWLFSSSLENPEGDFIDNDGATRSNQRDQIPDITARFLYKEKWGHVSFQSVLRYLTVDDGEYDDSEFGFGIGASGKIKATSKDYIRYHVSVGDGIGRYIQEASNSAASVKNQGTDLVNLKIQSTFGGYLGWQHWWTPTFRSNINTGYLKKDWNEEELGASVVDEQIEKLNSFHLNMIWRAMSALDLGVEFSMAKQTLVNGDDGDVQRLQMSTIYKF